MRCVYCSYFDHRYLPRGLAMIRSLRRVSPGAEVWVLCLSSEARQALEILAEPGVRLISLAEIEQGDNALALAKADGRSTVEYYFTLTPSLVRYVMAQSDADMVTYLDGDLYFFSDVAPIYEEMSSGSVLIIPHNFAPAMRYKEMYGRYNVGWLSFRADDDSRTCLEWWRNRTNEWCRDTPDEAEGRFCEQRYLDYFPERFRGVNVLTHPGANLAPWNIGNVVLSLQDGQVLVNGRPLVFFHFHGIKRVGPRRFFTVHRDYAAPMTRLIRDHLYRPYLRELTLVERETAPLLPSSVAVLRHAALPDDARFRLRIRLRLRLLRDQLAGYVVSV
jgi:hypothetical protein